MASKDKTPTEVIVVKVLEWVRLSKELMSMATSEDISRPQTMEDLMT